MGLGSRDAFGFSGTTLIGIQISKVIIDVLPEINMDVNSTEPVTLLAGLLSEINMDVGSTETGTLSAVVT